MCIQLIDEITNRIIQSHSQTESYISGLEERGETFPLSDDLPLWTEGDGEREGERRMRGGGGRGREGRARMNYKQLVYLVE